MDGKDYELVVCRLVEILPGLRSDGDSATPQERETLGKAYSAKHSQAILDEHRKARRPVETYRLNALRG